jgi:hypothetical protein
MTPGAWRNALCIVAGAASVQRAGAADADVKCIDFWHTESQWRAMQAVCEQGARRAPPG